MAEQVEPAFVSMPEAVKEFEQQLAAENEADFFPTGYQSHDKALGRLRRGTLTLVGARPSMGKTAFMLCMMLKQLLAGVRVYFFSLEMPRADMIARLVAIKTGLNLLDILQRRISAQQVQHIVGALPEISELPGDWSEETALKKIASLFSRIEKRSRSVAKRKTPVTFGFSR